jgi:hypothetical protein
VDCEILLINNYSIFIPIVGIWLWGLRNNHLFYNLLQFLTSVLYWFPTKNLYRSWTIAIGIGQTGRIFFSAEDYTNMSYYNCCGISPKYSNISKRVGEGVIAICVVLDQSTVIFLKGGGGINIVNGDLDLWPNDPKINRVLSLPHGNHVAKFVKDPIYRTQGFSQDFETIISHFCGTDFFFKLWINKNIMSLIL